MSFDPYYTWLGIPPAEQPPHHYRLLGVQLFEPNAEVIENAADRQMTHVRGFQTGPHSGESQRLLTAIAAARVTLLDPAKRPSYDAQLQASFAPTFSPGYAPASYASYPATQPPAYAPAPTYAPYVAPLPTYPAAPVYSAPAYVPQPSAPVTMPPAVPPVSPPAVVPQIARQAVPEIVETPATFVPEPTASPAAGPALSVRSESLGRRARQSRNPLHEALKIFGGGAVGIGIGLAILSYGFDIHPLGAPSTSEKQQGSSTGGSTTDLPNAAGPSATPPAVAANTPPTQAPPRDPPESATPPAPPKPNKSGEQGAKPATTDRANPAAATLEYRQADKALGGTFLRVDLRLVNGTATPIPLTELTFRYWYKNPGRRPLQGSAASPTIADGRITYQVISLDEPTPAVDEFCEFGFAKDAGVLPAAPGRVELRVQLAALDDAPHDGTQDFSRLAPSVEYARAERISVYRRGKLIGGAEPRELAGLQIEVTADVPPNIAAKLTDAFEIKAIGPTRVPPTTRREPQPIPSAEQLADAVKKVDEVFPLATKRTPKEKRDFARRMRTAALESDAQPAEQYVLFKRIAETAQETGDAKLVAETVDRMSERFVIDGPLVRHKLLLKTMDAVYDEGALKEIVEAARDTLFDLVLTERYDEALQLAERSDELCHKPFGKSFRKSVNEGRNAMRTLHGRWQDAVKARQQLTADDADPNANYVVGRWLCCQEDRWPVGLTALAKCSDGKLAALARADLATEEAPTDARTAARLAAADAWYDASQTSPVYKEFAPRALDLYEQISAQVEGLNRAKVDQRVKELRAAVAELDRTSLAWRALRQR